MSAFSRVSWLVGLSVWLLLSLAGSVQGQVGGQQQRRKAVLEGTHVLRRILFDHDFKAIGEFKDLESDPKRTLLIVLGDLDPIASERWGPGGLKRFVERGGAVLLASDRPSQPGPRQVFHDLAGVSLNENRVVGGNPADCYQGQNFCPYVIPRARARPALFDGVKGDLRRVATNVPSFLNLGRGFPGRIRPLANLPADCRLESAEDIAAQGPLVFMVGGDLGEGRVLVLADHSVFINEMMLPQDNVNVEFTVACIRWLRGDEGGVLGKRNRVLLYDEGRIEDNLAIPLKSAVIGPEEALRLLMANRNEILVKAEEGLAALERKDFFNEQFLGFLDRVGLPPERLVPLLLVLGTLVAMVVGLYLLGVRARFRHPKEVPLLAGELGRTLPGTPLVDQRVRALLRMGNLNEPAARLAARWFEGQGLPVTAAGPAEPPVELGGGWWRRRQLKGQLRRLWRLARGQSAERLGPAGLWRLQRELDRLEISRKRGEWQPQGRGSAA